MAVASGREEDRPSSARAFPDVQEAASAPRAEDFLSVPETQSSARDNPATAPTQEELSSALLGAATSSRGPCIFWSGTGTVKAAPSTAFIPARVKLGAGDGSAEAEEAPQNPRPGNGSLIPFQRHRSPCSRGTEACDFQHVEEDEGAAGRRSEGSSTAKQKAPWGEETRRSLAS